MVDVNTILGLAEIQRFFSRKKLFPIFMQLSFS